MAKGITKKNGIKRNRIFFPGFIADLAARFLFWEKTSEARLDGGLGCVCVEGHLGPVLPLQVNSPSMSIVESMSS